MIADNGGGDFLCILFSVGQRPLADWDTHVENGYIKRLTDPDIKTSVLEMCGASAERLSITTPREASSRLDIKLPIINLVVKNLSKYFMFTIDLIDDTKTKRTLKISNMALKAHVKADLCTIPLTMTNGWNTLNMDLGVLLKRAYGTNYVKTTRLTIHANCRIKRVYFANKELHEEDVPSEYRLVPQDTEEEDE